MVIAIEKVSTVGIRNQVTLPKSVREGIKINKKTQAYIQAIEKEDILVISLDPPSGGIFNKIKISEKGQLVIPKNLRESKGIGEGTNLVFSISADKNIKVQKLKERKEGKPAVKSWILVMEILDALNNMADLKNIDIDGQSLVINFKKEYKGKAMKNILAKLENLLGTRLMIEKLENNKVKLTPLA
ncbi:MAG: AbrB/MazE/SpoVT family DNA-binding domain-containing protein [Candidatus Hodarchaeales archaeon]